MNYATLQSTLLTRTTMGTDDPAAVYVPELVNEALHLVETANGSGWPWMRYVTDFSTVSGTSGYAFSTIDASHSIMKILSVKVLRSNIYAPLLQIGADEADDLYTATTNLPPDVWYVEGQTLYLRPTPDGVYSVRVRAVKAEPDLVNSTDTPVLPVQFHGAIIAAALTLLYQSIQSSGSMQQAQAQLNDWVARMQKYGREQSPAPRVRVRDWLGTPGFNT